MSAVPGEEQWELEVGRLLGALPPVDPPPGFIDAALDHRPLHAGRVMAGLLALSLLAMTAAIATDAVGRSRITPQIDELARQHDVVVRGGLLGSLTGEVDHVVDTPVEMPDGFQRTHNLEAEEVRQAVFARGDEAVSVFVQDGLVRWESLPAGSRIEIDGLIAWHDESMQTTLVQTSNETVLIVGMSSADAADVLATIPRREPTMLDRVHHTISSITGQLGYPDVG